MFYQVWLILAFLMSTKAFSVRIPKLNQFRKVCHHRCKMQSGDSFDISARTYQCVDFETLLKQVTNLTRTKLGCKFSSSRKAANAEEATLSYTMIYQLINEVHLLPLRRELNLDCFLDNLDSNIGLVERCDLVEVSEDFYNVEELRVFLSDNKGTLSLFQELAVNMELPPTLLSAFDGTFDTDGQLSISKYPTIRKLRNDIDVLQRSILGTLQALLQAPSMTGKLTDT